MNRPETLSVMTVNSSKMLIELSATSAAITMLLQSINVAMLFPCLYIESRTYKKHPVVGVDHKPFAWLNKFSTASTKSVYTVAILPSYTQYGWRQRQSTNQSTNRRRNQFTSKHTTVTFCSISTM